MDDVRLLYEQYDLLKTRKLGIAGRWVEFINTKMRSSIADNQYLVNLACLLEIQYKTKNDEDDFATTTCPMVRDIWGKSVLRNLISIQPIIGNHPIYYKYRNLNGEWLRADYNSVNPKYNVLRAIWSPNTIELAGQYHDLFLQEITAVLSDEIRLEHERRVLVHLCKNTSFEADLDLSKVKSFTSWKEKLRNELPEISEKISSRIGRKPNWIVTSPEIASAFETDDAYDGNYVGIRKITSDTEFGIYKDALFPASVMLMGYKGAEDIDAGFVCAVANPLVLDDPVDEYSDRRHFATFADYRFIENGEDWYIKINTRNMFNA